MKRLMASISAGIAVAAIALATPVRAQEPTAKVHGTVTDSIGVPVAKGDVKFTRQLNTAAKDAKFLYSFPLDANGNYKGEVAPGEYELFVLQDGTVADYQQVMVKAGEDKTANFDMTRAEYIATLTPEKKKEIEELKVKNASALSTNKVVANLNVTLKTVRDDLAAAAPAKADVSKDIDLMKQAIQAKPEESLLWITLGDAYQAQADSMAHANRVARKVPIDDPTAAEYAQAVDAYKKAIDLNVASKKPDPMFQATAYNQMGTSLGKSGKAQDGAAAYDNAAKLNPAKAGMYFGNEAAIMFNADQNDAALAAAEKAIAADPNSPDPYFIKGQALLPKATLDPKTNKLIAPPGCVDAYQKYLQLTSEPNGQMAQSSKEVLAELGEKIDTSYKAAKKK